MRTKYYSLLLLLGIFSLVMTCWAVAPANACDDGLVPESCDAVEAANQQGQIILAFSQAGQGLIVASSGTSLDDIPLEPPGMSDEELEAKDIGTIADPLEPVNRAFFYFNDKLYFWVLKPLAKGYSAVLPEPARVRVRNFFTNLTTPIRFVGCLLQGKFKYAGDELIRFVVNTTVGLLGFEDVAKQALDLPEREEDLGQTLGYYGAGPGFYICWPFFGPSSLRDWIGGMGEIFIDPTNYVARPLKYNLALRSYRQVNQTSLSFDDYESLRELALDPYVAVRDAYYQYRLNKIKE